MYKHVNSTRQFLFEWTPAIYFQEIKFATLNVSRYKRTFFIPIRTIESVAYIIIPIPTIESVA